jgi:predicted aldo/keto reductase-like oxidoreductase
MEKRKLGNTDMEVTIVSFGGIPIITRDYELSVKTVRRAYELGINFYDTARAYNTSEEKIGDTLKGVRDKVFYATKTHLRTRREAERHIQESLKNLRTSYIDLYQIHSVDDIDTLDRVMAKDGALPALEEAQKKGYIRYIGITGHRAEILIEAINRYPFATIMAPLNFLEQSHAANLLPLCREKNIGFIVMKPFAGGSLVTGDKDVQALIGAKSSGEMAKLSVKFALSFPGVSCVIPGLGNPQEVEEAVRAGEEFGALREEEKEIFERLKSILIEPFCRGCGYCLPCPQNIDIPSILRALLYAERFNLMERARNIYAQQAVKADACVECGVCEERCPYKLPIREMLKSARSIFTS